MLRKSLLTGAAFLIPWAAMAQGVNQVPQVGSISTIYRQPTYSASSIGLVPAASATDFFCISPGTTKNIAIRKIKVAGTAGTAITTPVVIYARATAATGGTPATSLAAPVPVPLNPNDPASTATLVAYTANPAVAANPLMMAVMEVNLPVTTAAGSNVETVMTFGSSVDMFSKGLDIPKNTTTQVCLNLNAVSVSSGVMTIYMEWTEMP